MKYKTDLPSAASRREDVQRCLHHIKSRGSGGGDEKWNLMPLTAEEHTEVHQIGLVAFSRKYPKVKAWLEVHGWSLTDAYGVERWIHA